MNGGGKIVLNVKIMTDYPPKLSDPWYRDAYYDDKYPQGGKYKVCLITLGQIESTLHHIKKLRDEKDFKQADEYRDKLLAIGYYTDWDTWEKKTLPAWRKSNEESIRISGEGMKTGVPFQNQLPALRYSVVEGVYTLKGYIHETDGKPGWTTDFQYQA